MKNLTRLFLVNSAILLLISVAANANEGLSLEAFMTIDQRKVINGSPLSISVTSMGGKGDVNYQLWLNGRPVVVDGLGQAVITSKKLGDNRLRLVANTATEQSTARAYFTVIAGSVNKTPLPSVAEIQKRYKDAQADKVSLIKKRSTKNAEQQH